MACNKILDPGRKAELRNAVAGILKSTKVPCSNVTKEERRAINTLKKDNTITIIPADKGRTTVVMDTKNYEKQMETLLQDKTTYEIIRKKKQRRKKRRSRLF